MTSGKISSGQLPGLKLLTVMLLLAVVIGGCGSRAPDPEWLSSAQEAWDAQSKIAKGMTRDRVKELLADAWHYDQCRADLDLFFFGSHDPQKAGVVDVYYIVTDQDGKPVNSGQPEMKPGWQAHVDRAYRVRDPDIPALDGCSSLDLKPRPRSYDDPFD